MGWGQYDHLAGFIAQAQAATVRITRSTAVMISDRFGITAAHSPLDENNEITPNLTATNLWGETRKIVNVYYDIENDFAIIELESAFDNSYAVKLADQPSAPGDDVFIVGHPWTTANSGVGWAVAFGSDAPVPLDEDDPQSIDIFDIDVQGGFSGSGIFNEQGELLGVLSYSFVYPEVRTIIEEKWPWYNEDLPTQNEPYDVRNGWLAGAIGIEYINSFLAQHDVENIPNYASASDLPINEPDPAKISILSEDEITIVENLATTDRNSSVLVSNAGAEDHTFSDFRSGGSGTLIHDDLVLSVAHVLDGRGDVSIGYYDRTTESNAKAFALAMFGDFGLIRLQEDSPDTVVPQEIAVTDLVKNDAAYITGSPRQFWYSEGGWWVISAKSKANEGFVSGAFDGGGMSGGGIFDLDSNIVGVLSVGWGGPRGARQDLTDRQDPHGTDYNPTIYSDVAYNGSSNFFYLKKFVSEHSPASIHGSSVDHFGSDIIRYDDAIIEFGWHLSNGRNVGYIRKYNADGTLDHSFGQSGEVQIEHGTSNQTIKCIIQVDHELIVFGNYSRAGKSNIYMSKLLSDGTFDAAFGRNGTIFFESDANENLASVVLGPNNEYFLAGTRFDGTSNDAFVLKVSSNGRADTEFGDDGYWIGVSPESSEFVSDIGMSQDGTIFVLSTTDKNRNWDFEVTSLSDTGTTNADFGSSGSVIGDYENEQDIANKLIVTEDGVYIGGYTNYSADESPLILKYDLLGNPDVEFGKNGKLFVSMGFGGNNYLTDMQFDSQGNIVALLSGVNLIQANEGWGDTISGNYVPKILTVDSSGNIRIDDSFVLTDFQGIYANSFLVEEGDIHLLLNNQGTRGFTSLVRGIEADGNIVKGKLGIIGIDFEGTDETEEITGTELDDFLDGNLGLDRIFGLGGDDFIWTNHYADGGSGNDKIIGWVGDDTLIGGTGFDHLSGQGGNDRLYASPDGGELHGHDGTDIGIFPGNVENYYAWRISDSSIMLSKKDNLSILYSILSVEEFEFDNWEGATEELINLRGYYPDDEVISLVLHDYLDEYFSPVIDGVSFHIIAGLASNSISLRGVGDDVVFAGLGDDRVDMGNGNDLAYGQGGDDLLNGGRGIDVAAYDGNKDLFSIQVDDSKELQGRGYESVIQVKDDRSGDIDTLLDIERLLFEDTSLAMDIYGNGGDAARIVGVVFGAEGLNNQVYVGAVLHELDEGTNKEDLITAALRFKLGNSFSPESVVETIYFNLIGVQPTENEIDHFASWIHDGQYTIGQFALLAADHELNEQNIDLVGIQSTGLEYTPYEG